MGLRLRNTVDGRRVEADRVVAATPDDAWDLLVDTDRWPEWGPSVGAVDCADRRIGPETTGRVRVAGVWFPFAVETFEDSGRDRRWTWRVARVPATGHRVEATPDGRCRVVFEIPPLAAGYAVVCGRALDSIEGLLTNETA
jgi:hypothetical protein